MPDPVTVLIETTDEDEAVALRAAAEAAGGSVIVDESETGTAFAPLLVIAVIGAAAVVARYITQGHGRIVDLTGDKPVITVDKNLRQNEILFLVLDGDGKATYKMEAAPESDLVNIINAGVKNAASAIVGAGGTKVA